MAPPPADARALWLTVLANRNGVIQLQAPYTSTIAPPGMYMLVLLTNKGVPSVARILSTAP